MGEQEAHITGESCYFGMRLQNSATMEGTVRYGAMYVYYETNVLAEVADVLKLLYSDGQRLSLALECCIFAFQLFGQPSSAPSVDTISIQYSIMRGARTHALLQSLYARKKSKHLSRS